MLRINFALSCEAILQVIISYFFLLAVMLVGGSETQDDRQVPDAILQSSTRGKE